MMLKRIRGIELGSSETSYKICNLNKKSIGIFVLKCSQINTVNKVEYHNAINEAGYILFFSPF